MSYQPLRNRQWTPESRPRPDYPLDASNPTKKPQGRCGPLLITNEPDRARFQEFMWDLINAMHKINLGLAHYKHCQHLGMLNEASEKPYEEAVKFYKEDFTQKWYAELHSYTTWVDPVISPEGYILDVRVISKAFSPQKPSQSSDDSGVSPAPSSSSSSSSS